MVVFLSWSGVKSLKVAELLKKWLPSIIQSVNPWLSKEDIKKGELWSTEISDKLVTSNIGVICLTKENLDKPWILFEAGALSRSMGKVCTLLLDVDPTDVEGPLSLFQATKLHDKEDMKKLVKTINDLMEIGRLENERLNQYFEKWWPDLEEQLLTIDLKSESVEQKQPAKRTDRELIEEVLILLRDQVAKKEEETRLSYIRTNKGLEGLLLGRIPVPDNIILSNDEIKIADAIRRVSINVSNEKNNLTS